MDASECTAEITARKKQGMNRPPEHYDLGFFRACRAAGRRFAMLTAYDFPTAAAAQSAGAQALLIGDSMGTVILGHDNTRHVPLELMLMLGEAVRRGAPAVYLVGDMPFEAISGGYEAVLRAAERFRTQAGCDAVKIEASGRDVELVRGLVEREIDTIVHLGLRPQEVLHPDGYRAQARDDAGIAALVEEARALVSAGAHMVLLEAVPNEASQAVVAAVEVPVIGCGAGPACHGHVVVTQDILGLGAPRPPRFVPVRAELRRVIDTALRGYVADVLSGAYPGPEHTYGLRRGPVGNE